MKSNGNLSIIYPQPIKVSNQSRRRCFNASSLVNCTQEFGMMQLLSQSYCGENHW